ncbi:hypothetical protein ISCGN_014706 [Ixodes scapularis]
MLGPGCDHVGGLRPGRLQRRPVVTKVVCYMPVGVWEADDAEDVRFARVCGARGVIRDLNIRAPRTRQQRAAAACETTAFSSATTFERGHTEKQETNDGTTVPARRVAALFCSKRGLTATPSAPAGFLQKRRSLLAVQPWIQHGRPGKAHHCDTLLRKRNIYSYSRST